LLVAVAVVEYPPAMLEALVVVELVGIKYLLLNL
jgi:hypothetical protein